MGATVQVVLWSTDRVLWSGGWTNVSINCRKTKSEAGAFGEM